MDSITQAQSEMRANYKSGSVGVIVSGCMWLISAIVANQYSPKQAVLALIVGGMLIHPLSILVYKILGTSGSHSKNNPLGSLGMEGTFFMLMCIPLAYGLSLQKTEWFFQGMLMIIGGRYLTFNTLYGNRLFWILGAVLGIAAYLLFTLKMAASVSALTGSVIEIVFGIFMYFKAKTS